MFAGHQPMGKVSIGAQWLIVAAVVLLCPIFVLPIPCLVGWLLFRRLWRPPEAGSGSAHTTISRLS